MVRAPELVEPSTGTARPILEAVDFHLWFGDKPILRGLDFRVSEEEFVAVIGMNGAGKSVTASAILGAFNVHHPSNHATPVRTAGRLEVLGRDIQRLSRVELQRLRAVSMSAILQDFTGTLNPVLSIEAQVREMHRLAPAASAKRPDPAELLTRTRFPDASRHDRPHQLSLGMMQRALTALALANEPQILITDEITSALDVINQRLLLSLLASERQRQRHAIVFVTHELALARRYADRVLVFYGGKIVEDGPAADVIDDPRHPATRQLMRPVVTTNGRLDRAPAQTGCVFYASCDPSVRTKQCQHSVRAHTVSKNKSWQIACNHAPTKHDAPALTGDAVSDTPEGAGAPDSNGIPLLVATHVEQSFRQPLRPVRRVLRDIDLEIYPGQHLGLVGASGSGKTTLGNVLAGVYPIGRRQRTQIRFDGHDLRDLRRSGNPLRHRIQMVFQDTGVETGSLDPRLTVEELIIEPWQVRRPAETNEARQWTRKQLERFGLTQMGNRLASELSGGQRQRVEILRAFSGLSRNEPVLVIADEPTSMLDPLFAQQVVVILRELTQEFDVTYVAITHNLEMVRSLCKRIAVMLDGCIVEQADLTAVFDPTRPSHPYTELLLSTSTGESLGLWADHLEEYHVSEGSKGCPIHSCCPKREEICKNFRPALQGTQNHQIACHRQAASD